ncbi:MAG: hypothetical protein OXC38_05135 [Gammaproteobacteria bacterium]|nr:hypothetical protein [Gammaproteobacteria bacterium]
MGQTTFTFRVDPDLKSDFVSVVKSFDRTGAQVLRDYMREIVLRQQESDGYNDWFRREVQIGLDSAKAGHLVAADAVEEKFAARRAATRRQIEKTQ